MNAYIPILLMILAAGGISAVLIALSSLIGPKKPNPVKQSPYECGMAPIGGARVRFSVKFYQVAILFLVFDIESAFLYPWAVLYRKLSCAGTFAGGVCSGERGAISVPEKNATSS